MSSAIVLGLTTMAKGGGSGTPGGGRGFWIALGVFVLVVAGAVTAYNAGLFGGSGDPCASVGGRSIHEHVELFVFLDSDRPYDFSPQKYQIATQFLHLEEGPADANGATMHVHAARPTLACFFDTVNWEASERAIKTDTGSRFVADDTHEITILLNGEPAPEGFETMLRGRGDPCDAPGQCPTFVVRYAEKGADAPPEDENATQQGHAAEHGA